MELHDHPDRRKEPTVIAMPTHPAPVQCEDIFDHTLHRFHRLPALLAELLVCGQIGGGAAMGFSFLLEIAPSCHNLLCS
jgi:hypothetical protein